MTTTKDLISAIKDGKSQQMQKIFDEIVTEKVSAAIDDRRQQVIDSVFGISESTEEETDDKDEPAADSSLDESEELQLEDYSLDEIEEFMVSEEFDTLDELSKTTLKSYYKKASADRTKAQDTAQKYADKATSQSIKTSTNTQRYKDLKGKADAAGDRMSKRTAGTDAAGKRLGYFKEEEELQLEDYSLEEIDELSK